MAKRSEARDVPHSDSAEADAFREELPDRPLKRFLFAFVCFTPIVWLVAVGYMHASAVRATIAAPFVAVVFGLIAMFGKRPLAWLLNFLHGGL